MGRNKDEKFKRSFLLQGSLKQYHFFSTLYEKYSEKIKKFNKLGNPNKITNTFASFSKVSLTRLSKTQILTILAIIVVPITAIVGAVLQFLQNQELKIQLVFQEKTSITLHSSVVTGTVVEEFFQFFSTNECLILFPTKTKRRKLNKNSAMITFQAVLKKLRSKTHCLLYVTS